MPIASFFFLKIVLTTLDLLWLYIQILRFFFYFCKKFIGILIGNTLDLYIIFRSMTILRILIFPIQEHRIYFHLFIIIFTFFISVLQLSVYRSFTFLVKFIPKYVILFDAIINGIVLLIPFSNNSLLVYKYSTDLYVDFVSCNFIEIFHYSQQRRWRIWAFIYIRSRHLQTDNFISSFPIWISFISFYCLISLSRSSGTMLNRSCWSGNHCLFPDPGKKAFSFSLLCMIPAVGSSYMAFIIVRCIPLLKILRVFNHEMMLSFVI